MREQEGHLAAPSPSFSGRALREHRRPTGAAFLLGYLYLSPRFSAGWPGLFPHRAHLNGQTFLHISFLLGHPWWSHCAHRTSTVSPCAFCEHRTTRVFPIYLSPSWGAAWLNPQLRASREHRFTVRPLRIADCTGFPNLSCSLSPYRGRSVWSPTARGQRGPSEAARCASTGDQQTALPLS